MNINSTEALKLIEPAFDFLDGVISDYGLYIFVGFVYALIPFSIWALSGELRRNLLRGKPMPHGQPVIVLHIPVGIPPQPTETFDPFPPLYEPPRYDHDDYPLG
jgi:hypothetical protein